MTSWLAFCIWLTLVYFNTRLNILRWQATTYFGGPLRLVSSKLRWAPLLTNSCQAEGYSSSVWSNGTLFLLPTSASDRQQFRDVSVVYEGQESDASFSKGEQGRCFEWKPFGIATFNALTMKSVRGSKRVVAQFSCCQLPGGFLPRNSTQVRCPVPCDC